MRKEKIMYKFIGETSRSIFERTLEHTSAMISLASGSYILKYHLDVHESEEIDPNRFGFKVIKFTKTSFERQILESVKLQENIHHHLLNSKAEYNRCAIPWLTTKIGEKDYTRWGEDEKEEKIREFQLEEKIRKLRKMRNMRRGTKKFMMKNSPHQQRRE